MVGVVLLAFWWLLRPPGPRYQGRDVQGWLLFWEHEIQTATWSDGPDLSLKPKVLAAFRAMGTNAIPALVDAALTTPPDSRRRKAAIWLEYNFPALTRQIPDRVGIWLVSGDVQWLAQEALAELRPPAALLFPLVTHRLVGPEHMAAMKLLTDVNDNQEGAARLLAPFVSEAPGPTVQCLSRLGPAAAVALPQLIAGLSDTDSKVRNRIISCLEVIGRGASNALPALRPAYEAETNQFRRFAIAMTAVQIAIAMTAVQIGAPEFWAEDELRVLLNGKNRPRQREALEQLVLWTNVAPLFARELETLARCTSEAAPPACCTVPVAALAIDALYHANLDRSRIMQVLADCIWSRNLYVRVSALDHLLELRPINEPALACLTNTLTKPLTRTLDGGALHDRLVARLVKLVPVNPQAQQALDGLRISPTDVAAVEARITKRAYDASRF
jgi:hypothetical protein